MMAQFPALPLWTDSYLADTGHLTDGEHGIYLQLLILMWRCPECRIPNDDKWIARHFRRSIEDTKKSIRPVISEFCKNDGNWITQGRLKDEWNYLKNKSKSQSARAKSRWRKEKKVYPDDAQTMPPTLPTPIPKEEPLITPHEDPNTKIKQAVELWNTFAGEHDMPKVQSLTKSRISACRQRLKECGGLDGWKMALEKIRESPYWMGDNNNGFLANFDSLIRAKNFTKLMEGGYNGRNQGRNREAEERDNLMAGLRRAACGDQGEGENAREPEDCGGNAVRDTFDLGDP